MQNFSSQYYEIISFWREILERELRIKINCISEPARTTQSDSYNCGVFISWYGKNFIQEASVQTCFNPLQFRKIIYDALAGDCLFGDEFDLNVCPECRIIVSKSFADCSICSRKVHLSCISAASGHFFRCSV